MATDIGEFPLKSLLPKKETQSESFVLKYPQYNGHGVTIAVLDSGIDPNVPGLRETPDGRRKVIDMIDGTGAGDVDTSATVTIDPIERTVAGLTGRLLKIPGDWNCPTGAFHVGIKNGYELYPKAVKDRIAKDYEDEQFAPRLKMSQAESMRALQAYEGENKLDKEELQSRCDILNNVDKKPLPLSLGPTYDCLVFHDGSQWKACIDTSENGDLAECTVLSTYKDSLQSATLTHLDMLNYVVNIHDDGNLLEIVSMTSSHGTHVASIAAGYFPDEPEKNGVAPGAQIISCCIGDVRVGTMETGSALMRALIRVIEAGADVINMSYGEPSHYNSGRILDMIHDVVNKYGVIFVTSAGNSGPALTTVGTPTYMHSSSVLGIGAYVSPDMMLSEYSMRTHLPAVGYTWSSRGPTKDGDIGVNICAPGGAVTTVPAWSLKRAQMMNGTSMSSPNAAGCVALLLSGLKAKGIKYSPYSVRRCIENTALRLPCWDPFAMGSGLIQVDKAFDQLVTTCDSMDTEVRFRLSCGDSKCRGIYLRQPQATSKTLVRTITVEPLFLNHNETDPNKKLDFEMHMTMVCDESWVSCPAYLSMTCTTKAFSVKVEPQGLPPGVHFASVKAYDSNCPERGPIFQLPITVIKTTPIDEKTWTLTRSENDMKPGLLLRDFIDVPNGATGATIKIRNCDSNLSGVFVIHALQLQGQKSFRVNENYKMVTLGPDSDATSSFALKGGRTLEVCVGKWWSNLGELKASYSVELHGLKPSSDEIAMQFSEQIHRIDLQTSVRYEDIAPTVSLKHLVLPMRPNENKIRPLGKRDIIPQGRQIYQLVLTYSFQLPKPAEIVLNCPLLSDYLYESEYESQLWMIFDCNKQLLLTGDAYPSKYTAKLEKGDYTVRMQIRHEDTSKLEKMTDTTLLLSQKLLTPVTMDIYGSRTDAILDRKKVTHIRMSPYTHRPLFIAGIPQDKLPKGLTLAVGSYFLGTISYAKDEGRKKSELYSFKYIIDSEPSKSKSKDGKKDEPKAIDEQYSEALKEFQTNWLAKLTCKLGDNLYKELCKEDQNASAIIARMACLDADGERKRHLMEIIDLSNDVIKMISMNDLIAAIAAAKTEKKDGNDRDMVAFKNTEKQKQQLIDALVRKGLAICELMEDEQSDGNNSVSNDGDVVSSSTSSPTPQQSVPFKVADIDQIYTELLKLTDQHDAKVSKFMEKHAMTKNHYGRCIKLLMKIQENKPTLETEQKLIDLFDKLNWNHLSTLYRRCIHVKYPKDYRPF